MRPIKYIVHTFTAWHKTNGYSTHCCMVWNCALGKKAFRFESGGRSNGVSMVRRLIGCEWDDVLEINEDASVRQVSHMLKNESCKHESFCADELKAFLTCMEA